MMNNDGGKASKIVTIVSTKEKRSYQKQDRVVICTVELFYANNSVL